MGPRAVIISEQMDAVAERLSESLAAVRKLQATGQLRAHWVNPLARWA
jgi:hypothetical protein